MEVALVGHDTTVPVQSLHEDNPAAAALVHDYLQGLVHLDPLTAVNVVHPLHNAFVHLEAVRDRHPWRYAGVDLSGWWPPSDVRTAAAASVRRAHSHIGPDLSRAARDLARSLHVPLPLRPYWL
jgi:hypothetical protein